MNLEARIRKSHVMRERVYYPELTTPTEPNLARGRDEAVHANLKLVSRLTLFVSI